MKEEIVEKVELESSTLKTSEIETIRAVVLKAQQELSKMTRFLEERRKQNYKPLVQVHEHLKHIGDEVVEMRNSLENSEGQTNEFERPHKDVADVEDVKDELDEHVGPRPSTLQASEKDDSHEDVMEMEEMKEELVEQVEPRQDT